jgi:hypothetical protein
MRIRIGRRRHADDAVHTAAAALAGVRDAQATGCLTISHRPSGSTARVFALDGAVYAVALEHYEFPVALRLGSSALLDEPAIAAIAATTPVEHPDFGRIAVATGKVDVADLGRLHQELVLAGAGAVLALDDAEATFEPGIVTGDFCTVPISVDALLEMVELRHERLCAGWQTVSGDRDPAHCIVAATGTAPAGEAFAPELTAMLAALDGARTVDQAAAACGFTRAEAVHLVSTLVALGHAEACEGSGSPDRGLDVPEAFGRTCVADEPLPALDSVRPVQSEAEPEADAVPAPCDAVDLAAQELTALVIDGTVLLHPAMDSDGEIDLLRHELAEAEDRAAGIRTRLQQALERCDVHVH